MRHCGRLWLCLRVVVVRSLHSFSHLGAFSSFSTQRQQCSSSCLAVPACPVFQVLVYGWTMRNRQLLCPDPSAAAERPLHPRRSRLSPPRARVGKAFRCPGYLAAPHVYNRRRNSKPLWLTRPSDAFCSTILRFEPSNHHGILRNTAYKSATKHINHGFPRLR